MFDSTKNPALRESIFTQSQDITAGESMTIDGTVNKTFMLFVILMVAAGAVWNTFFSSQNIALVQTLTIAGSIGGVVIALVTGFKKDWAPVTAPIFAACEGLMVGGASAFMEMAYPGIVMQAVSLTFAVMGGLLFAYKARWIVVTDKMRSIFRLGLFAVFIVYMISFVMSFFGMNFPFIHDSGPIGIGFSLVVIVLAAGNLLVDFDFIEKAANHYKAPKYMEWYSAFALIVTLVWLYMEILRLLAKLRRR